MKRRTKLAAVLGGGALLPLLAAGAVSAPLPFSLTNVPDANSKSVGVSRPNILSPELQQIEWARGSFKVENPGAVSYYGYDSNVRNADGEPVMVAPPGAVQSPTNDIEASKTEPDKNLYLVFPGGLKGADPAYDYGTRFVFQGHEGGSPGYVTRVNLDADGAHRVTLLATAETTGAALPDFDGITWEPWAQRLLLTAEAGTNGGVWASDLAVPAHVTPLPALGKGGYEGIQNDSAGDLWIAEDVGGSSPNDAAGNPTNARRPNSFIYRYVPKAPGDLANGKLQALQVLAAGGSPITAASTAAVGAPDLVALNTYGRTFATRWVTLHDTTTDGTAPFDSNALAKASSATPFKRPENGQFRPGSDFREFYFDATGDTNATSTENACCGGWGQIFKLVQSSPSADSGTLSLFYKGDRAHAAFDNVAFLSSSEVAFVEDAGDGLHAQRNALDSGFVWDVARDYSDPANQPVRWLAQGRDASGTFDSPLTDARPGNGFKNDGDNEPTGLHVSNGDPSTGGILGAQTPELFAGAGGRGRGEGNAKGGWRWFYSQQHGDNVLFEVIAAPSHR